MRTILILILYFACACNTSDRSDKRKHLENQTPVEFDLGGKTVALRENLKAKNDLSKEILSLYQAIDFEPVWLDDGLNFKKETHELIGLLRNSRRYGLEPSYYKLEIIDSLIEARNESKVNDEIQQISTLLEAEISNRYFQFGKHLHRGVIQDPSLFSFLPTKGSQLNFAEYFEQAFNKNQLISSLIDLQPKQESYRKLQRSLEKFVDTSNFSIERINVPTFKEDSLNSVRLATQVLQIHQLISKEIDDSIFFRSLKKFQKVHGLKQDGIIGLNTAKALSLSPFQDYQSAAASLERWRWKPNWEENFIHVNIPSYNLQFFTDNKLKSQHRVVIGSRSNTTPEVYSRLSYLVAYPYWHVPRSISVEEILVKAKKDPDYLSNNHYDVLIGKEKVDPKKINWDTVNRNNFKMFFRQKGGSYNALGLVKFIFDNPYLIYLHDTPSKNYFARDLRAYSHGCIRVQEAIELADKILLWDQNIFTKDSIQHYVELKKEKMMPIENKLAIYIQYIVCDVNEQNELIFYQDVYNKDEQLIEMMFDPKFKPN